jgi:O-antigen/teichoic acid export membrane protein
MSSAPRWLPSAVVLVLSQAATAAALLLVARRAGPDSFGAFAALYTASATLAVVLDLGSVPYMTRVVAGGGSGGYASWIWSRTGAHTILAMPFALVAWVVFGDRLSGVVVCGLCAQAATIGFAGAALVPIRALGDPFLAGVFTLLGNLMTLGIVVIAPRQSLFAWTAIAAVSSWVITGALGLWIATRWVTIRPRRRRWVNPWLGARELGGYTVAIAASGFDLAAFALVAPDRSNGLVAGVARWTQPLQIPVSSFNAVMFPQLVRAESKRSALALLRAAWRPMLLAFLGVILLLGGSGQLVARLLGSDYTGAVPVLRVMALAALPMLLAQPLVLLLVARGGGQWLSWAGLLVNGAYLMAILGLGRGSSAMMFPALNLAAAFVFLVLVAVGVFRLPERSQRTEPSHGGEGSSAVPGA